MKKTIVFILSSNFSGSHYLSLVLSGHSNISHLGELKNLVKDPERKVSSGNDESSRYCFICGKGRHCSLFDGLHLVDRKSLYSELFSRSKGKSVLVDSSKKVRWANQFTHANGYNIKYIHLVRDPRSYVSKLMSSSKNRSRWAEFFKALKSRPTHVLDLMSEDKVGLLARKWVRQNEEITQFLNNSGREFRTITYKELAVNTEVVVAGLLSWLGFEYERGQEDYWMFDHHGTQKSRYSFGKTEGRHMFDLKWRQNLSCANQYRVVTNIAVTQYLSDLNLEIGQDGLTATP